VTGHTGGTVTFSGAITDTAGSSGISLTSNGGTTIAFTGGLSLTTTTNTAFTATRGGTVTATQNNTPHRNQPKPTSPTALNVANTTIGAAGLTFRSISSNGAVNGVVLNNTGSSGGLVATGDNGASNNGSGGVIQNSTGIGVSLTSTSNVSLGYMNIQ